jgi:hypothetical protein
MLRELRRGAFETNMNSRRREPASYGHETPSDFGTHVVLAIAHHLLSADINIPDRRSPCNKYEGIEPSVAHGSGEVGVIFVQNDEIGATTGSQSANLAL